MKKQFPFHPFILAAYPIVALYAQMPGGLKSITLVRPILIAAALTGFLFFCFQRLSKVLQRAGFLSALAIFYFSSTGYVYRIIQEHLWHQTPAATHLGFVLFGVFILIVMSQPRIWEKYLTPVRLATLTGYLNALSILLLLAPLYTIGSTWIRAADDTPVPWNELIRHGEAARTLGSDSPPDIYYIILDGYSREDVLRDIYQFDNSAFITALQERGFYVAGQSHSNYTQTILSLSSSLNMNYLDFATQAAGEDSADLLPLYGLIQHSESRTLLEETGYVTVATGTDYGFTEWSDADTRLSPYHVELSELERYYLLTTALGALYDSETTLTPALRQILPVPSYGTRRESIVFALEALTTIPAIRGPKFVFVHVISPHPPFVLDRQGNALRNNRPYRPADGMDSAVNVDEYRKLYIEQLQFTNEKVLHAIDAIFAESARPPVIIIQGDHGGGSLMSAGSSCFFERTSILNAYYFPNQQAQTLYPSITPVNSFRVVFNAYFGTDYPLLQDRTYFTPGTGFYNFVDISDQLDPPCKITNE